MAGIAAQSDYRRKYPGESVNTHSCADGLSRRIAKKEAVQIDTASFFYGTFSLHPLKCIERSLLNRVKRAKNRSCLERYISAG